MKLEDAEQRQDLYPDRYLNVFVPYGTHLRDVNVTRALISTLRWSRPELTRAFLEQVVGVEAGAGAYHHDLQVCDYEDFDPGACPRQVVLGISIGGELATRLPPLDDQARGQALLSVLRAPAPDGLKLEQVRAMLARSELDLDDMHCLYHALEELEQGGYPDGWVFSADAGVCVLIEAKLLRRLDLSQLQRYAAVYYGRELEASDVTLLTWERVAAFFAERRQDEDPRTAFLCAQLHDYLDLLGLAPFNGFKPYDMDLDTRHEALAKFFKFVQAVREEALGQGLPLGEPSATTGGARLPFGADDLPGELRLELMTTGIRAELVLGDSSQGQRPGRASLDWLLERTENGKLNPLARPKDAKQQSTDGLHVRLERLRQDRGHPEPFVERELFCQPLQPDGFDEVLAELALQHPPLERARGAAGEYRAGRLAIGQDIPRSEALSPARSLLDLTVEAVVRLTRLARALTEGLEAGSGSGSS